MAKKALKVTREQYYKLSVAIHQAVDHLDNAHDAAEAAHVLAEIGADFGLIEANSDYPFDAHMAMSGAVKGTSEAIHTTMRIVSDLHGVLLDIAEVNGLNDKPKAA